MGTCSRCGNPIEFRYVDGRCVPLHLYGGCIGDVNIGVNDYSGYSTCYESTCFCTTCPKCGDEVFFMRHNGGSVWIDPPLGPPWYKHGCFEDTQNTSSRTSLASCYKLDETVIRDNSQLIIGIVKSTYVDYLKIYTDVLLQTGKSETVNLKVKNNAGFLLGKLCIYNKKSKTIWPAEEPAYLFELYKPPKPPEPKVKLMQCPEPECNAKLNPKNLSRHLRRQHGYS